jgi:hypothetical protein
MRSELDVRGEYYVANAQELLFIPPDGQPPRTSVVSVSPNALSAAGLSYVTFRSLGFVHARQAGASLTQSDHIVFSECEFALNGGDGLGLSAIDSAIQGSHVHDVGCSGIYVASGDAYQLANGNLLVQDNTVRCAVCVCVCVCVCVYVCVFVCIYTLSHPHATPRSSALAAGRERTVPDSDGRVRG